MKAYRVHWVVVDLDSGKRSSSYVVIAECPERSSTSVIGSPYPKFLIEDDRAPDKSRLIPSEIANDKKMLENHLFLTTGLEWRVF